MAGRVFTPGDKVNLVWLFAEGGGPSMDFGPMVVSPRVRKTYKVIGSEVLERYWGKDAEDLSYRVTTPHGPFVVDKCIVFEADQEEEAQKKADAMNKEMWR